MPVFSGVQAVDFMPAFAGVPVIAEVYMLFLVLSQCSVFGLPASILC
jgi:hypothetical protein